MVGCDEHRDQDAQYSAHGRHGYTNRHQHEQVEQRRKANRGQDRVLALPIGVNVTKQQCHQASSQHRRGGADHGKEAEGPGKIMYLPIEPTKALADEDAGFKPEGLS